VLRLHLAFDKGAQTLLEKIKRLPYPFVRE